MARASIREARAQLTQQRSAQLPGVSANGTYLRAEVPGVDLGGGESGGGSGGSTSLAFYNAGLNASWEVDLFGRVRNLTQAQQQAYFAAEENRNAAQVTLVAETATAWLTMAAAVHRSADEREGWYPAQQLQPREALAASTDGVAALEPGDTLVITTLDRLGRST